VPSRYDPDVARARTPEASFYTDTGEHARELEEVIGRSWQLAGHAAQLAEAGDFFTTEICGEPLLLVNDGGTLRAFFNVCRHRAGPVATGCGRQRLFACRYHGWTYDLTGQLVRAPEMEEAVDFDPADIRLEPARIDRWGPLLFVAIERDLPPVAEFFPGLDADCAPYGLERMRHGVGRTYPVNANWKVYVDNFLEGYHIPLVHPGLNREIDYRSYATSLRPRHVVQAAAVREQGTAHFHAQAGEPPAAYIWLYPNMMLNLYQGQLQTNLVVARGVDRCEVLFDWYAPQTLEELRWRELVRFGDEIQAEDAEICARVQQNLRSRAYRPGPYSPRREDGVHHFHGLMRDALK
jgi:choline monooxygenase